VRTPNPVTGRGVPGAPVLELSGCHGVPINPIVDVRHPWHPRHPIIGLRRTRAESEGGGAQRTGDCRCARDFLRCPTEGTTIACGLRQISRPPFHDFIRLLRCRECQTSISADTPENARTAEASTTCRGSEFLQDSFKIPTRAARNTLRIDLRPGQIAPAKPREREESNPVDRPYAPKPSYARRSPVYMDRAAIQRASADAFTVISMMAATAPAGLPWVCATIIAGSLLTAGLRPTVSETPVAASSRACVSPRLRGQMLACALRHYLWRAVCSWSGGLTTTGRWPQAGGCVLVANHSSHADTAVLLAALPPRARPVFVAASDYWFDVPVRRFLITSLAGGLPVRRTEGGCYAALLAAAKPALAQGRTVVIYPEGTRSTDGKIGEFRSGALHLARDCGVPVVPVALLGTGEVLPKYGRYSPSPLEVRFGEPIDPTATAAEDLRRDVVALRDEHPVRERQSRVGSAIARLVTGPHDRPGRPDQPADRLVGAKRGQRLASPAEAA
jgi:1-acyl-sn-glycerol-3-phosphate acyltransferase